MSPLVGGKVSRSCSTAPAGAWPPGGGMGAGLPSGRRSPHLHLPIEPPRCRPVLCRNPPRSPLHRARALSLPARRHVVRAARLQRLHVEEQLVQAAAEAARSRLVHGGDEVGDDPRARAAEDVVVEHGGEERARLLQHGDVRTLGLRAQHAQHGVVPVAPPAIARQVCEAELDAVHVALPPHTVLRVGDRGARQASSLERRDGHAEAEAAVGDEDLRQRERVVPMLAARPRRDHLRRRAISTEPRVAPWVALVQRKELAMQPVVLDELALACHQALHLRSDAAPRMRRRLVERPPHVAADDLPLHLQPRLVKRRRHAAALRQPRPKAGPVDLEGTSAERDLEHGEEAAGAVGAVEEAPRRRREAGREARRPKLHSPPHASAMQARGLRVPRSQELVVEDGVRGDRARRAKSRAPSYSIEASSVSSGSMSWSQ